MSRFASICRKTGHCLVAINRGARTNSLRHVRIDDGLIGFVFVGEF